MVSNDHSPPVNGMVEDITVTRPVWMMLAVVAALAIGGRALAAQSPTVTVSPVNGNQFQSFAVTGTGFTPGTALEAWWQSPDGEWFTTYSSDGPAVTVVPASGTVRIVVVPAVDFAGARAGKWSVYLCISGSTDCWSAEFTVSA